MLNKSNNLIKMYLNKNAPLHDLIKGIPLSKINVQFSSVENKLFNLIRKTISFYNLKTNARVAGGWVRDKLLGITSKDIDIALDNLKGVQFIKYLKKFDEKNTFSSIGCIKKNPEKSKNLETITFNVFGISVDLNNLRKEKYDLTSRIPIIEIGTPKEDAERRDFNLNALFYNINSNKFEDFTQKGINDLINWKLRTPLCPLITFLDDPLRAIRACRFSSTYGFIIDKEIINSVKNINFKKSLKTKVSKERIGIEIKKIFQSDDFLIGILNLTEMEIFDIIFNYLNINLVLNKKGTFSFELDEFVDKLFEKYFVKDHDEFERKSIMFVENIYKNKPKLKKINYFNCKKDVFIALSVLFPLSFLKYQKNDLNKKNKIINYIVLQSLKLKKSFCKEIEKAISYLIKIIKIISNLKINKSKTENEKIEFLFELASYVADTKQNWCFYLDFLHFMMDNDMITNKTNILKNIIKNNNLENCYQLKEKPFFNGNDFKKLLNIPSGKIYKKIIEEQFRWRLENTNGSKEQCLIFLKHKFKNLG